MARSALPQNYRLDPGELIDLLDSVENSNPWSGTGTIEKDATIYKEGTGSCKISATAAGTAVGFAKDINFSTLGYVPNLSFWIYCYGTPASNFSSIRVNISSTASGAFSSFFQASVTMTRSSPGWNLITIPASAWSSSGGESWSNTMRRVLFTLTPMSGKTQSAAVNALRFGYDHQHKILITFDDSREVHYTNSYSIMAARGLRGTIYVNSATVDNAPGDVSYLSLAQVQTMYAAGWAIANHSDAHVHLDQIDYADALLAIENCRDWLLENDFPRAAYHLAYPYGTFDSDVFLAMSAAGMLTGRTTTAVTQQVLPDSLKYQIPGKDVQTTDSLATILTLVDGAIKGGYTLFLTFHDISDSPPDQWSWSISDFTALCDYLVSRHANCPTIDEWYNGLTNPRYQSLPVGRSAL